MDSNKILVVDDDQDIQELLSYNLIKSGYCIDIAGSGEEALRYLNKKYSLIILDIMMPKMDGFELCQHIRTYNIKNKNVPIIFLTAKDTELDEMLGFKMGADDFIVKPIRINKLLARIKTIIKRTNRNSNFSNNLNWGTLVVSEESRTVEINSNRIKLTKSEFDILFTLLSKENKVFRRDELLNLIQKEDSIVTDRVIDVHIKKIRDKLKEYCVVIETVHGIGYVARKDNIPENH